MPGLLETRSLSPCDVIVDDGIDLAWITETWVMGEVDVSLGDLPPPPLPGFSVQHWPRLVGWGGRGAVVYRKEIMLTEKC